jgi:putative transposase
MKLCIRFPLSLGNVEDLLHEGCIDLSHDTERCWWNRFGPIFASAINHKQAQSLH